MVDNKLSTVAVSITFNVLTPVSNLKVSLLGTVNIALSLPWLSVFNCVPFEVPPLTP